MQPKVSIIIPVHNTAEYLKRCLDSAVNQTLRDIEIICIDDASDDGSTEILQAYQRKDGRICLVRYEVNKTASQARKDGVERASGEYVMFMDSDDYLELNACEALYQRIESEKVEILQFGTFVEPLPTVRQAAIDSFNVFVLPCTWHLYGRDVFDACFVTRKYRFNLWNKIYKASLCKEAFSYVEDGAYPKAQDLYAYFMIAWFAQSYYGIKQKFYHYTYGSGVTGGARQSSLSTIKRCCTQAKVAEKLREFLFLHNAWSKYSVMWTQLNNDLRNECLGLWKRRISDEDCVAALDVLAETWGINELHEWFCDTPPEILNDLMRRSKGAHVFELPVFRDVTSLSSENMLSEKEELDIPAEYERLIPVVMATDDNYACFVGLAIESIRAFASAGNFYKIYVLFNKLSVYHIQKLESIKDKNLCVKCVNVSRLIDEKGAELVTRAHFTKEMYYRLLIPEILPFFDNVIYLDSDLLVNRDLGEMPISFLGDNYLAAVRNYVGRATRIRLARDFDLRAEEYFNTGVLIFNISAWLRDNLVQRCFDYLKKVDLGKLIYPDQDLLNVICRGKVFYMDETWNFYWNMLHGDPEYVKLCRTVSKRLVNNYSILHYASDKKPWNQPELDLSSVFWQAVEPSAFKMEILRKTMEQQKNEVNRVSLKQRNRKLYIFSKNSKTKKTLEEAYRVICGGIKSCRVYGIKYTLYRTVEYLKKTLSGGRKK